MTRSRLGICLAVVVFLTGGWDRLFAQLPDADGANLESYGLPRLNVGRGDWPQWGGTSLRNNAPHGANIPADWAIPDEDLRQKPKNIKWSADHLMFFGFWRRSSSGMAQSAGMFAPCGALFRNDVPPHCGQSPRPTFNLGSP